MVVAYIINVYSDIFDLELDKVLIPATNYCDLAFGMLFDIVF